jgi:hypothetical protein
MSKLNLPPIQADGSHAPQPVNYEFNGEQNTVISGLAGAMKFCGVVTLVLGTLTAVRGLFQCLDKADFRSFAELVQGIVMGLVGGWLVNAARSFRAIVDTQGGDIPNLMSALTYLKKVYVLQAVLLAIAMALGVIAFLLIVSTR